MFRSRISHAVDRLTVQALDRQHEPVRQQPVEPTRQPEILRILEVWVGEIDAHGAGPPRGGRLLPRHAVGSAFASIVNTGTESVTPPVQLSRTRPSPVLAYALPSMM